MRTDRQMCEADLPGLSGEQVEESPQGPFLAAQMDLPRGQGSVSMETQRSLCIMKPDYRGASPTWGKTVIPAYTTILESYTRACGVQG